MNKLRPGGCPAFFSSAALKLIAITAMAIDHTRLVFFRGTGLYTPMRIIGRLAFPIFCFLLVEGAQKTRSMGRYALRLFIFALISEVPFDLAIYREPFYWGYQNVFFTLLFGLLMLWVVKRAKNSLIMLAGVAFCGAAAYFLKTDYGLWGVALILSFYVASVVPFAGAALFAVLMIFKGGLEVWGLLALIPIFFYNGERGRQSKYFFYGFYPVHLLIIAAVYYRINY